MKITADIIDPEIAKSLEAVELKKGRVYIIFFDREKFDPQRLQMMAELISKEVGRRVFVVAKDSLQVAKL